MDWWIAYKNTLLWYLIWIDDCVWEQSRTSKFGKGLNCESIDYGKKMSEIQGNGVHGLKLCEK